MDTIKRMAWRISCCLKWSGWEKVPCRSVLTLLSSQSLIVLYAIFKFRIFYWCDRFNFFFLSPSLWWTIGSSPTNRTETWLSLTWSTSSSSVLAAKVHSGYSDVEISCCVILPIPEALSLFIITGVVSGEMFRHMQNSEIIRKMTEEFDEAIFNFLWSML